VTGETFIAGSERKTTSRTATLKMSQLRKNTPFYFVGLHLGTRHSEQ